jgi:two-component system cell cycle sensor histidine kinase/response regulator CckA
VAQTPNPVVLLVEDDQQVRTLLVGVLEAHGFTILPTDCGEAAVTVARTRHVDVLLTDVVLPRMDGFQTADRVRAVVPHVQTVFMSGYVHEALASVVGPDVTASVLKKPFTMATLVDRIRRALAAVERPAR